MDAGQAQTVTAKQLQVGGGLGIKRLGWVGRRPWVTAVRCVCTYIDPLDDLRTVVGTVCLFALLHITRGLAEDRQW